MKKTIARIFTVLFLILCLLPFLGLLIAGPAPAAANEIAAQPPKLREKDGSFNTAVLQDFSAYVAGRFFPRQSLVTARARLYKLLGTSATQSVVLGKDGWLYYADTLPDYEGTAPMSGTELFDCTRTLELMQEYAESQGCGFLFTVCPNKNSLYPEHMPFAGTAGPHDAELLAERLAAAGVNYADLFAALGEKDEELYFATDTHWNMRGAAAGADAMLTALGREEHWYAGEFIWDPVAPTRDLYAMLYPAGTRGEVYKNPTHAFAQTYLGNFQSTGDITVRSESPVGTGTLLCYRDSFGTSLIPYLAEDFASATFSRKNAYDLSPLAAGDTDVLIIELVERNLTFLLNYSHLLPAPQREEGVLGDAERLTGNPVSAAPQKAFEGYALWELNLPAVHDAETGIYVRTVSGTLYEALPRPGKAVLSLPEGETPAFVLYQANGTAFSSPVTAEP